MSGSTSGGASSTSAKQTITPQQANMMARRLILRGGTVGSGKNAIQYPPALDVWQPQNPILPSAPAPGSVMTFVLRNVGLVKRLVIRISATITNPAGPVQTLTPWGLANLVSNVTFYDLGNNQRINTTGWHLTAISSAKRRRVFGAAYTSDTPFGYGNNNTLTQVAPASIASDTSGNIVFELEVPFVKNDSDLRGSIFADVTQQQMQVQVTLNPNMFVATGADPTLAMYQSSTAVLPTLGSVAVQVFQNYLDQLPRTAAGQPILPNLDIGTAYLLNNTASGLPTANQQNGFAFVNGRKYESLVFGYDNNGTLNVNGSDLSYIAISSANMTNILYVDGPMLALMERNVIMDDFPKGMHYLDFRHRPVDTEQYGNMQFIVQPSSVGGAGAVILMGWESFGVIGQVNQGGSLPMAA